MIPTAADLTPSEASVGQLRSLLVDASDPATVNPALLSFTATPIGTGQVGENVRFELEWDRAGLPGSVVGKFPSTDPKSFAAGQQMGVYRTEVGFYRALRPHVQIRTPALYFSAIDETDRFCLLMEDIAGGTQGDQLEGTDLVRAELAIDQAVGLHAPTWGRADSYTSPEFGWLSGPGPASTIRRNELYRVLFPGFVARYRETISAEAIGLGYELMERLDAHAEASLALTADRAALCVTHADYRLDNMLFRHSGTEVELVVVDWQTCRLGLGPSDIAYFIGGGLTAADRAEHELALVDRYHRGLLTAGVEVGWDWLWESYLLGSASGYVMAVVASQVVGQTERGDAMFCVMAERHAAQIRSLGLPDRLS